MPPSSISWRHFIFFMRKLVEHRILGFEKLLLQCLALHPLPPMTTGTVNLVSKILTNEFSQGYLVITK